MASRRGEFYAMTAHPHAQSLAQTERDRAAAWDEAARIAEQRDNFTTSILLGLATINGTSIVALMTAVGGASAFLTKIGFTSELLALSVSCFAAGTVAAGLSMFAHERHLERTADYAKARALTLNNASMLLEQSTTDEWDKQVKDTFDEVTGYFHETLKRPVTSRWMKFAAGAAWAAGVLVPVINTVIVELSRSV